LNLFILFFNHFLYFRFFLGYSRRKHLVQMTSTMFLFSLFKIIVCHHYQIPLDMLQEAKFLFLWTFACLGIVTIFQGIQLLISYVLTPCRNFSTQWFAYFGNRSRWSQEIAFRSKDMMMFQFGKILGSIYLVIGSNTILILFIWKGLIVFYKFYPHFSFWTYLVPLNGFLEKITNSEQIPWIIIVLLALPLIILAIYLLGCMICFISALLLIILASILPILTCFLGFTTGLGIYLVMELLFFICLLMFGSELILR